MFLEEAAGRFEVQGTAQGDREPRLSDTRDNLSRVEDILRELNGQIDAARASRPKSPGATGRWKTSATDKQQWLWMIRRDEALKEGERLRRPGRAQCDRRPRP